MTDPDLFGYFADLGATVSQRWTARGRAWTGLPAVAEAALSDVVPPAGLDCLQLVAGAARWADLPMQGSKSDTFGQPPLIMYREADFFIQALVWLDGTTAVHDHIFGGAFRVLQGSSLHVTYDFSPACAVAGDQLVVGAMSQHSPEILATGAVRRIEPGSGFIHALYHLERPSVTVVVRNERDAAGPAIEYRYRLPGLASDGLWNDRGWLRRQQSIDVSLALDPEAGWALVNEVVEGAPLWEAFWVLTNYCGSHGWGDRGAALADRLVRRAPDLRGVLSDALEYDASIRRILLRRGMLVELHQRLLLALMANLPDASDVAAIIGVLFPDQRPLDLLLDWAEQLASPALRGISGLSMAADQITDYRTSLHPGQEAVLLGELRHRWGAVQRAPR